ncbi:MAG: hypothetical protein QOG96_1996 [Pseudonocardiales bacterium]|nr:hypothetical protein [Pseudonocardiales bacterium]
MGSEPGASPATFGEFGAAALGEVFTPRFLQRQLDAALSSLRRGTNWLPDFAADLVSARAATPTLLSDDGFERSFAVTVRAVLEVEVGPRLLGMSVDATAEIDLTVRVRTFRPAIAQLHIDPVTSRDLRVRARTRAGLLPLPLSAGGTRPLAELVERSLPIFAGALNRALAATAVQRQFDVVDRIRRSQAGAGSPVESRTGTLLPDESVEWPIELREHERMALMLWAGIRTEPGTGHPTAPSWWSLTPPPAVPIELSLSDGGGRPIGEVRLPVYRTVPDLDTTAAGAGLTVAASRASDYLARLVNRGARPLAYRIEDQRRTVAGERIGFAEFGESLIRLGVDRTTVSNAVGDQLTRGAQVEFNAPNLVRGTIGARLTEVTALPPGEDELRFRLSLLVDLELTIGPGSGATVLTSTLDAQVPLRVSTMTGPAALLVTFDPVSAGDLRLVEPPRQVGGRRIPLLKRALAELLPHRVAAELNRRLAEASRRIVAAELVTDRPEPVAGESDALRGRTSFSGVVSAGQPSLHSIRLDDQQRIRAKARIIAGAPGSPEPGGAPDDLAGEIAVCDEHGGVWAADLATIPSDGEPKTVGIEFTAPQAGQWRLRVASAGGPGDLEYDLQIRPDPY